MEKIEITRQDFREKFKQVEDKIAHRNISLEELELGLFGPREWWIRPEDKFEPDCSNRHAFISIAWVGGWVRVREVLDE